MAVPTLRLRFLALTATLPLCTGFLQAETPRLSDDPDIAACQQAYGEGLGKSQEDWYSDCEKKAPREKPQRRASAERDSEPTPPPPPADASSIETVKGLERAVQTADLPHAYDLSGPGGHGSLPVYGGGRTAGSPRAAQEDPARARAADVPSQGGGQVDEDLRRQAYATIQYEAPPSFLSGWGSIGQWLDDHIIRPVRTFFSFGEKRFVREATDRLLESDEGRSIVRGLVSEYKDKGRTVSVQKREYKGTSIYPAEGGERLSGTRGESDSDLGVYYFNEEYLNMGDRESAIKSAAANMGHELTHLSRRAHLASVLPRYALVYTCCSSADEQLARLEGYVVALELGQGRRDPMTAEAEDALEGDFWRAIKFRNKYYVVGLDQAEMADPQASYQARAKEADALLAQRKEELKTSESNLAKVTHMADKHPDLVSREPVGLLKANLTNGQANLKTEIDTLEKEVIPALKTHIEAVNRERLPDGTPLVKLIQAAAKDKDYKREVLDPVAEALAKLQERVKKLPPPPARSEVAGAIKRVTDLWAQSHDPDGNEKTK